MERYFIHISEKSDGMFFVYKLEFSFSHEKIAFAEK